MSLLNFEFPLITGEMKSLSDYEGQVVLVVNTASNCGFTPQYEGLEEIYRMYKDKGFVVLAFPCNQFGDQEPGNSEDIQGFLNSNYTVTFPVFGKIEVNGEEEHPFFRALKTMAPGTMGTKNIKWNFTKFLISRDGTRVERFASSKRPEKIVASIERELEL
ncbi:MAG: glutathione peroxidase [Denitrovibrio sp.]|nr:MAG: glutathione peroxidase [Denitrovibrio sp.]